MSKRHRPTAITEAVVFDPPEPVPFGRGETVIQPLGDFLGVVAGIGAVRMFLARATRAWCWLGALWTDTTPPDTPLGSCCRARRDRATVPAPDGAAGIVLRRLSLIPHIWGLMPLWMSSG